MDTVVPRWYFDDRYTKSYQFAIQNETLIAIVNVKHGFVQYLFLVQAKKRQINKSQPRVQMVHRSRPFPVQQISSHPNTVNQPLCRHCIRMGNPRAVVGIPHLGHLFCLDYLWETCNERDDTENGIHNIQPEALPNTQLLNYLCQTLGRKSLLIKVLCKKICLDLKTRFSAIKDVWAAYVPDKENEITFMVITDKKCKSPNILDRPFVHRCIDAFSAEAAYVIAKERPLKGDNRTKLRKIVNKHTGTLLCKHTNINVISVSSMKSKFFERQKHLLRFEPCIVIYVHVKGMIPIDEDPLPTTLDGYATDVREGAFSPFVLESSQVYDQVRMGCQIQGPGDNIDEGGNVLGGTLGGFIDHPSFGICCFTSAHVMLQDRDMLDIAQEGSSQPQSHLSCYQPCPPHKFGRVVLAVCKEGTDDSPGVEVIMMKLEDRPPDSQGRFPGVDVLAYRSGEILDHSELLQHMNSSYMEVIKYGAETGITTGKFHSEETTIRFSNTPVSHGKFNFTLRNQIEVAADVTFAKPGDSGAIVFHFSQNKSLKAIGMLEGGTSYNTFIVTPIYTILNSLGLPPPLHMKVFDHVSMETTNVEYLDQRVENLEKTTDIIKVDVADIKTELQQQRQKLDQILTLLSART